MLLICEQIQNPVWRNFAAAQKDVTTFRVDVNNLLTDNETVASGYFFTYC